MFIEDDQDVANEVINTMYNYAMSISVNMLVFAQGHLYILVMVKMEKSSLDLKPS